MKTKTEVTKGKPCKVCGGILRYVNSGKCIECHKARNAARKWGKVKTTGADTKSKAVTPVNGGDSAALNVGDRASAWGGLARRVKALIERADKAADKAEQFYKSAGLTIKEIKEKFPNWEAIVRDECGIGRSRAYELMAIADGRTTLEKVRASINERQKIHKARSQSVITDKPEPPVIEAEVIEETSPTEATPLSIYISGNEPVMAADKIVVMLGKEYAELLIVELKKRIAAEEAA